MHTCSVHHVCEPCVWWEGTEETLESLQSLGWRRGRRGGFGLRIQGLVGDVGMGCGNALGFMSSSFRMWGSFLQKQTEVSLVKHSRQVQGIRGPCCMRHFSCKALNKEDSLWTGPLAAPYFRPASSATTFWSLMDSSCLGA